MSPAVAIETGVQTPGVPQLVSRVLVTAALDERSWAELTTVGIAWQFRWGGGL